MKNINWLHFGLLMGASTLWGMSFLSVKLIIETIPPFTFTFARNFLVTTVLVTVLYSRGGRLPAFGRNWIPFIIVGAFDNAIPVLISSWAQQHVDSALAAIFVAIVPFFVVILSKIFLADELLTPNKLIGIAFGAIGMFMLIGPSSLTSLGNNFLSQMALLLSSFFYAVSAVYMRGFLREDAGSKRLSVLELLTGQFIVSALIALPAMLLFDDLAAIRPSTTSTLALLFTSWIIGIGAFSCYYRLNALAGPTYASFITYLIPINGVIWGALILGERVTPSAIAALAIILLGVAIVNNVIPLPKRFRAAV